jgi:uncharacterized membrane protein YfcA
MAAFAIGHTAWLVTLLVLAGACTGMLAGLFGVGGGTVVVPVLYEVFGLYGVPDEIRMPLCIGTSLAIIVPTSISSFAGHYEKGAVDIAVLRKWVLPIIVGVIGGIVVASFAKPLLFKVVFVVVSLFLAVRLLAGKDKWRLGEKLPGVVGLTGYGLIIGLSSSLMGIGGGLLANLVLCLYGTPIHAAVATASGVGLIVSIPGALGYIASGWNQGSLMTVRYGVNFAHRLDERRMEVALAAYLFFISLRFGASIY